MIPEIKIEPEHSLALRGIYWVCAITILYPMLSVGVLLLAAVGVVFAFAVAILAIPMGFWDETARLLGQEHMMVRAMVERLGGADGKEPEEGGA